MRRFVRSRTMRLLALAALPVATLILIVVSRSALPMGVSGPIAIAALDRAYSAQLSGYVDVPGGRPHQIGFAFDGGARLVVDGRVVGAVSLGGREFTPSPVEPGVHFVQVQFRPNEAGDLPVLYLLPENGWQTPVPAAALSPRRLTHAGWVVRRNLQWASLTVALTWMALGLGFGIERGRAWFAGRLPPSNEERRAAWALVIFAVAMFAYPLWWGIPVSWSDDEVLPLQLDEVTAMLMPGWHSKYPPLHMIVLAVVNAPILGASALGMLDGFSTPVVAAAKTANNLVSVTMAVGITAIVYLCASRAMGHRVGMLAGVMWVVTLPALYYAKTANLDVPYTFWFALALLAYQAALDRQTVSTYALFAAAAALSVVTKDQAYGLYGLPAVHLAVRRYRTLNGLGAVARDPAILGAIAVGVLLFAGVHNLFWNWQGFRAHVDIITGGASEGYRMVDSVSPAGQAWLLGRNLQQVAWSLSWPGALLALGGLVWGLGSPATRQRLVPFVIPAISYYLTFIAVVGYTYDRFLLPVCVLLAVFAGVALDRLWPAGANRWRTAGVAGLLVFMSLRAGSINLLMGADGRHEVKRWMLANVPPQSRVVVFESWALLPNLKPFAAETMRYPMHELHAVRPEVIVLSDSYRRRFPEGDPEISWHDALISGEMGYRVALRYRAPVPLAILTLEQQFRNPDPSFSVLHKVNPEITVLFRNDR